MHLHFLIPGLLWPTEHYKAALKDARLPALAALLGRGRPGWQAPVSREAWLSGHFGLNPAPLAALRLAGETEGDPGRDGWLCADPVQLSFTQQGLMLADASTLDLGMEEAIAIIDSLNREFPDLGQFHAASPEHWYLRPAHPVTLVSHRLAEVVGRRVDRFLPGGPDGMAWRRHFNEIQVLLHTHAVNEAREAAGRPKVNSVWFWGEGALPDAAAPSTFDAVITNDILARGFARQAGLTPRATGDGLVLDAGRTLTMVDSLLRPALYSDLDAWCDALQAFDRDWLAPALAALRAGRLSRLSLTGLGDRASMALDLTRRDLWKFWRPARPFPSFDIPDLSGQETP